MNPHLSDSLPMLFNPISVSKVEDAVGALFLSFEHLMFQHMPEGFLSALPGAGWEGQGINLPGSIPLPRRDESWKINPAPSLRGGIALR